MRRLLVLFVMALMFLMAAPAMAQEGSKSRPDGFGIGLGQGTLASGLSAKMHRGPVAFQGVAGCWSSLSCHTFGVSVDVLFNMPIFVDADVLQMGWNIGGGGALAIGNTFAVGGQFVAGLEFIFPSIPIDLVLEWRPRVYVTDRLHLGFLGAGGHLRIYL